jgi:hypothetical protein
MHARHTQVFAMRAWQIGNVGESHAHESGKHRVDENDEGNFAGRRSVELSFVIPGIARR